MKKHALILLFLVLINNLLLSQKSDTTIIFNGKRTSITYPKGVTDEEKKVYISSIARSEDIVKSAVVKLKDLVFLDSIPLGNDPCLNGSFEINDTSNWTGIRLCNAGGGLPVGVGLGTDEYSSCKEGGFGFENSEDYGERLHRIESGGIDPILNSFNIQLSKTAPNSADTYSMRLGNNERGRGAEGIARKFIVDNSTLRYYFQYAIVMDKSHDEEDSAFFLAIAFDENGEEIDRFHDVAYEHNPFIKSPSGSSKYYREWNCEYLDLRGFRGKEVTVFFVNSDCAWGAHRGYTYIDEVCVPCQDEEGSVEIILDSRDSCIFTFPTEVKGTFIAPSNYDTLRIKLHIYQNGFKTDSLYSPIINGNEFIFSLEESDFSNQQCFDLIAELHFQLLDMTDSLQDVSRYSSRLNGGGIKYGKNNDICLDCCNDCPGSFAPIPGKPYVLSAWVKEKAPPDTLTYHGPEIQIKFPATSQSRGPFKASGPIIEGWQQIESVFIVPDDAIDIEIILSNAGANEVFFDDIRIHPFDATMKSYVYDPVSLKLVAELDERNFATFYEYDEEGKLVRVKKETERGIKMIQESRFSRVKKQTTTDRWKTEEYRFNRPKKVKE